MNSYFVELITQDDGGEDFVRTYVPPGRIKKVVHDEDNAFVRVTLDDGKEWCCDFTQTPAVHPHLAAANYVNRLRGLPEIDQHQWLNQTLKDAREREAAEELAW